MNKMNPKRSRSINWDDEEKQLLRSVLKDYAHIIEDKSLNTNTNKNKTKAWEEVHIKFNGLNCRQRELNQLKIQWKVMKVNARKTYSSYRQEAIKTGGGARPATPDDSVIEVKDLLNPAELLRDDNPFDSDGLVPNTSAINEVLSSTSGTCAIISLPDFKPYEVKSPAIDLVLIDKASQEYEQDPNIITIEDTDMQVDAQKTPLRIPEENLIETPLLQTNMSKITARKAPKRKLNYKNIVNRAGPDSVLNTNKDLDYVSTILSHSKNLKDEEHRRRIEMAEEEHKIKMRIQQEKLKSAILEREILELKKAREEMLTEI